MNLALEILITSIVLALPKESVCTPSLSTICIKIRESSMLVIPMLSNQELSTGTNPRWLEITLELMVDKSSTLTADTMSLRVSSKKFLIVKSNSNMSTQLTTNSVVKQIADLFHIDRVQMTLLSRRLLMYTGKDHQWWKNK